MHDACYCGLIAGTSPGRFPVTTLIGLVVFVVKYTKTCKLRGQRQIAKLM